MRSLEEAQRGTKELISTTREQQNAILVGVTLTQQLAVSIQQQKELAERHVKGVEQLLEMQRTHSKELAQIQELILSQKSAHEASMHSLTGQITGLKDTVNELAKVIPRNVPNMDGNAFNHRPIPPKPVALRVPHLPTDPSSSSPIRDSGPQLVASSTDRQYWGRQGSFIERLESTPRSTRMGWHLHNQLINEKLPFITSETAQVGCGIGMDDIASRTTQVRSSSPFLLSSPTSTALALGVRPRQTSSGFSASFKRPFDMMERNPLEGPPSSTSPGSSLIPLTSNPRQPSRASSRSSRFLALLPSPTMTEAPTGLSGKNEIQRLKTFAYSRNSILENQPPDAMAEQGHVRKKFKVMYTGYLGYVPSISSPRTNYRGQYYRTRS
ncbi:uncharacterized protein EI90DRAFT_3050766 [Cantharellus anzutake]|uniref:uncharacterized protein n=1 Tax=Cantharellus anzutake TaxID=1750568 RepID=UPI001907944C|nr:uncharacterized protein EI90DRAFT_3050766 [Cantharellus anzutake]KAF8334034.1 hypothetical protein EI90DRAFT_3050766 [Cantharellus anzutake]